MPDYRLMKNQAQDDWMVGKTIYLFINHNDRIYYSVVRRIRISAFVKKRGGGLKSVHPLWCFYKSKVWVLIMYNSL